MEKQKFPNWAPKEIILEWEDKLKEIEYWQSKFPSTVPDAEDADLLLRLLTYHDMKCVWEKLKKYNIKPKLFSSMVQYSIQYITAQPHNLTPKEYNEWLSDVRTTALKLKSLLMFSEYDRIFQNHYLAKRQKYVLSSIVNHSL